MLRDAAGVRDRPRRVLAYATPERNAQPLDVIMRCGATAWRVPVAVVCVWLVGSRSASGTPPTTEANLPWAFRPVVVAPPPRVGAELPASDPVDAFVLYRLALAGLKPWGEADAVVLVRRVHFDLIGLPPDPAVVRAFLRDRRPDRYERLVDRLLASPRFGEKWARHWLDVVRYADSDGFKRDALRPLAYRYRDWVIRAFNANLPYDQFVLLQLAGDEVAPYDRDAVAATAYLRHWPFEDNQRDLVRRRQDILNELTDTTATAFLGLTLKCARCHEHKYDPLTQEDYYAFQAFFAAVQPEDRLVGSVEELRRYRARQAAWEAATAAIRRQMAAIEAPYRQRHFEDARAKFPPDVQKAIDTPPEKRTPVQRQLYALARNQLEISTADLVGRMNKQDRKRWEKLKARLDAFAHLKPPELPEMMTVREVSTPPVCFVLARGNARAPLRAVEPAFPRALAGGTHQPEIHPVVFEDYRSSGRRTALARWIASADNPLTARVFVNRLWQHLFGRGLVETSEDFGSRASPPSHPELLDWLAHYFIDSGWNIKRTLRLIVTSATYRRSSIPRLKAASETNRQTDPDNRLLWRMNRKRLTGEAIRDAMLAVAGTLNLQMFGPAVRPELPEGISQTYAWKPTAERAQRQRRSVYLLVRRNLRHPLLEAFDFPDANEPCTRRSVTITPPQAHYLLNSRFARRCAADFARRILQHRAAGSCDGAAVERAYWLAFGRPPDRAELSRALAFIARQRELIAAESADGNGKLVPYVGPDGGIDGIEPATAAAWVDFCLALLNANEFVFID